MGVKLGELVPKREISFEDLKGKRIAIDFSNVAYQFLSSIRQQDGTPLMDSRGRITSVYMGILTRFTNLMSRDIKQVVVFDGKSPILKIKTQEEREYRKQIAEKKLKEAEKEEDIELMYKYAKQTSRLTREIIDESKILIKAFGLPIINAPSEADAQISFLAEKNDVWAAATSDLDPLLYNCPRIVTNLTLSQRRRLPSGTYVKITPELIELNTVLKMLNIKQDQLLIMAILVGTDYNQGIRGIGPKTALKLVQQYKGFDKIFKEVKADFNWKEIYAVFKSMPIMKNYQLKWTDVDEEMILKLLVDKHDFSEERVKKTLEKLKEVKSQQSQKGLKDYFNIF